MKKALSNTRPNNHPRFGAQLGEYSGAEEKNLGCISVGRGKNINLNHPFCVFENLFSEGHGTRLGL